MSRTTSTASLAIFKNDTVSRPPTGRLYLNGVDESEVDVAVIYRRSDTLQSSSQHRRLDSEEGSERQARNTGLKRGKAMEVEMNQSNSRPATPPRQAVNSGAELAAGESRSSRFVEEMATDITASAPPVAPLSADAEEQAPPRRHSASNSVGGSSSTAAFVNPATVPIRTSSRTINGDGSSTTSPKQSKSPRKHRSMASVPEEYKQRQHYPEVDERHWFSQSKQDKHRSEPRSTLSGSPTAMATYGHMPQPSLASSTGSGDALRSLPADLITGSTADWNAEKENILKGPFDYLESHPGKDIRTQLITAFNSWLHVPAPSLGIITHVVTMLHTASLLIDDVEDSSQLRRGVPVAHSIFGTAQTINSANYVYFLALQELLKLRNDEAVKIYAEELVNLHRGQGMDLFWRDTLTCPSEDDYLEMVGNKTGGLFRLAVRLMCAESPVYNHRKAPNGNGISEPQDLKRTDSSELYIPLVNTIGLLFQILDDYRNLSDTTYTSNKGLCEDLTEGKFSFPIIHAIRADPSNLVLINILRQKTQDDEVKKFAVGYMESVGAFSYTRRVLRGLVRRAGGLVEGVDGGRGEGGGVRDVLEKLRV